jgi:hypothetical protein
MHAAVAAHRDKEEARLARLRRPSSAPDSRSPWERAQWSLWPESPARSGVSTRNRASLPGGVIVIDGDNDEFYWD